MIIFRNEEYELLFSNNLKPLTALNYADEDFFNSFESLCGARYRILSIIRNGWQHKYGKASDLAKLKPAFRKMLTKGKSRNLLRAYLKGAKELKGFLKREPNIELLPIIKKKASLLDAMSNMLHLFSVYMAADFMSCLKSYTNDEEIINQNLQFYIQPLKSSKFAKIKKIRVSKLIKLSKEQEELKDMLRLAAFVKDDVSSLLDERNKFIDKTIGNKDAYYLTLDELNSNPTNKELINNRKKITVLFYSNKNIFMTEGKKAEEFLSNGNFKEIKDSEYQTYTGEKASFGVAIGKAIVVKNSGEAINQIKKGDILIAPYTAVEYLPAMRLAAAIITETGGITSHAAIIAREFKIPCIVGVKGITSLKSGTMIEVDANKGIITIKKK
jgi:phosphohistidine swiveling domain-containing protein